MLSFFQLFHKCLLQLEIDFFSYQPTVCSNANKKVKSYGKNCHNNVHYCCFGVIFIHFNQIFAQWVFNWQFEYMFNVIKKLNVLKVNSLSAHPTKWSNTLKKFDGKLFECVGPFYGVKPTELLLTIKSILFVLIIIRILNHLPPIYPFSAPWKHQKTLWISNIFRG